MKHEPATVGRKLCKKCGEEKSVLAFAADPTHADGMHSECRDCDYKIYKKPRYVARKQTGEIKSKRTRYVW